MRLTKPLRSVFLVSFFIFFVSACTVKTLYKQLDIVLLAFVEDYIDLTEDQMWQVDKQITDLHQWHQYTQLPRYSADLRQLKTYTEQGMTAEQLEGIGTTFVGHWNALKGQVVPIAVDTFVSLDKAQIDALLENMQDKNRDIEKQEQALSDEERLERGQDNLVKNFERWLGDLSSEQTALLNDRAKQFKAIYQGRLEFRRRWQQALASILTQTTSLAEKRTQLGVLLSEPRSYQSEAYQAGLKHNLNVIKQAILAISPTLTTAQKRHLNERLDELIQAFDELATEKLAQQ